LYAREVVRRAVVPGRGPLGTPSAGEIDGGDDHGHVRLEFAFQGLQL
jgi:hypothetical protein